MSLVSAYPGQSLRQIIAQASSPLIVDRYVALGARATDPPVVVPATLTLSVPSNLGGWIDLQDGILQIDGVFKADSNRAFTWTEWSPAIDPHLTKQYPFLARSFPLNRPSGRIIWGPGSVADIRPEWYGAVPDGATASPPTDNKFFIQQAIDDAYASWRKGGVHSVLLSPGTYVVGTAGNYLKHQVMSLSYEDGSGNSVAGQSLAYPEDKYVIPPDYYPVEYPSWGQQCVLCSRPHVYIHGDVSRPGSQIDTILKLGDHVRDTFLGGNYFGGGFGEPRQVMEHRSSSITAKLSSTARSNILRSTIMRKTT